MNVTRIAHATPLSGAFDPFLMESFGVEENGMALTVLSTLARLGLDPWAEARHLAALPKPAAAALIARHLALKGDPAVAAQLAGLLPDCTATAPLGNPAERLRDGLRRNLWLWVTLFLAACVFSASIADQHRVPEGAARLTVSSTGSGGLNTH